MLNYYITKTLYLEVGSHSQRYRTSDLENWEVLLGDIWLPVYLEFYPDHELHQVIKEIPYQIEQELCT